MQLHVVQTTISLMLFFGGFFMIGMGAESGSEKQGGLLAFVGFVLMVANLIFLGTLTLDQTLVK